MLLHLLEQEAEVALVAHKQLLRKERLRREKSLAMWQAALAEAAAEKPHGLFSAVRLFG